VFADLMLDLKMRVHTVAIAAVWGSGLPGEIISAGQVIPHPQGET
jgi:hypothetical protein